MDIRAMAERELREFLDEQRALLTDISEKSSLHLDDLKDIFGITAQQERAEIFDYIIDELTAQTRAAPQGPDQLPTHTRPANPGSR